MCRRRVVTAVLGFQRSIEKSAALFSGRVAQAMDVRCSSNKSLSVDTKKAREPRKSSGLKVARRPGANPLRGTDIINVGPIQADVL